MDLGNIFKKQEEGPEYFWTLVIGKSWVGAGIWRVVADRTEVIAEGKGGSWEEASEETLIQAADSALSAAAAGFEDEETPEPTKVVFGLPPSWVESGNIKQDRLAILKKLSEELELSPAGFVVLPEALVHYLKTKEGAGPNIVLVGIEEDSVDVSLVQNGRLEGTFGVGRSISLGADVAEGLARFSATGQYPSRIVLYNHKTADLEEAKQNLLEADWEEVKINFLHTPKVEILAEDVAIPAVSLAGGAEVGEAKTVEVPKETFRQGPQAPDAEVSGEQEPEELRQVSPEELGFLAGDIAEEEPEKLELAQAEPQPKPQPQLQTTESRKKFTAFFGLITSLRQLRLPRLNFLPQGAGAWKLALLGLFVFLLLLGVAYWYLPRAEVTIYVAPRRLDKEVALSVEPGLTVVNREEKVIPGRKASASVAGEKTTSATGAKTVGDRAKGTVTIRRVGPPLTLQKGTAIESQNGLEFTLDESVQVATGSSAFNPSEAPASVTAADIGAQYNLAADTEFSVGNFSKFDLVAKNAEAFSGGSSREIAAVSEEDRKNLEESLAAELKNQGLEKLRAELRGDEVLIEDTELGVEKRNFSHRPGEEANTLKLNLSGKLAALIVPKDALHSLVSAELEREVPQGYVLRPEQIKTAFRAQEKEGSFLVSVEVNLLPQVNPDEVARQIAGKYPDVAKTYLSTIPGYTRAQMSFNLRLPVKLRTLPRVAKNIVIVVAAER